MKYIFSNAKFGDKFITRDGKCALLVELSPESHNATLWVQDDGEQYYYNDGTHDECEELDIVGIWEGGEE